MGNNHRFESWTVEAYKDGEKQYAYHGVKSFEVGNAVILITREGLTAIVDLEEGEE